MTAPAHFILTAALLSIATASPCTLLVPEAAAQEQPIASERNPPGDIPDSQVFVKYASPLGFSLNVPEGWALSERTDGARFVDKYDAVDIAVSIAAALPAPMQVRQDAAATLTNTGRAVRIASIREIALPAGPAILITYSSNSEPNAVTDKRIRLDNNRYLFYRAGRQVALTLSAPAGADNADQWQLMSRSFRWN